MIKQTIYLAYFDSPIWVLTLWALNNGLCMLEFEHGKNAKHKLQELRKYLDLEVVEKENHILKETKKQLQEYFEWKRKTFEIPLLTFGTAFQKASWKTLQKIPYGETWSYKQEAEKVGSPKAVRAVGSANGKNRIGIFIPCHRVIGNDGGLGWFGWGLEAKKWLLEHEKKIMWA